MGGELSTLQSAPQTTGDVVRDLSAEFPDFVPQSVLGNLKIFKVVHCVHEQLRSCVVKLFFSDAALAPYVHRVLEIRSRLVGPVHGNLALFEFAEASSSGRAAIMVRPFFAASLFDRLYAAPQLTPGQKKFLALQMTCAVLQLHSVRLAHGNLKLDNFFVSGNLTVHLADPGIFKPVKFPGDDPVALYSLFHEADLKRRKCFIAPERFAGVEESLGFALSFFGDFSGVFSELAQMDAFGLGCSLAELFLDGPHVADLPELLLFRASGGFDPAQVLDKLEDVGIGNLIRKSLRRNPRERATVQETLDALLEICPEDFSALLFPLFTVANTTAVYQQSADARLALLRANLGSFLPEISGVSAIDAFTELEIFNTANFPHPRISRSSGKSFFEKLRHMWTTADSLTSVAGLAEVSAAMAVLTSSPEASDAGNCGASADPETLEIFVSLVCATGSGCSQTRCKQVYLEILGTAVEIGGLSEAGLSDVVIPHVQEFVASEAGGGNWKLRGLALEVLGQAVAKLGKSETGLFSDYIFPGLLQGDPVQNFPIALGVASEAVRLAAVTGEDFDKKFSVIRMFVERAFLRVSLNKQSAKQMMISNMEILLKFVEEKTVISVLSGFFTDAHWQVRGEACRKLTSGNFLSPHARDKIIFPGVMACLYDADERVILSALRGIGNLVPKISSKQNIQVAERVFPLLHHPAKLLVTAEAEILLTEKISDHISQVDQLVALRHWLLPHRCLEELGCSQKFPIANTAIPYDLLEQLAFRETSSTGAASGTAGVPFEFRRAAEKLKPFVAAYARGMLSRTREDVGNATQLFEQLAGNHHHSVQVQTLNAAITGTRDFRFLAELESHMRPRRTQNAGLSEISSGERKLRALCVPGKPLEVGTLSQLDGSYLNLYGNFAGAAASLQRDHVGLAFPGGLRTGTSGPGTSGPEGVLLATLYEFWGERIAGVDCTDDGRILAVAGGKRILCYRLGNLDREAYLSASKTLTVLGGASDAGGRIRKLRTVRNSKSVVVGTSGSVEIFRLDVRGETPLARLQLRTEDAEVVDVCQFDAAFESCVFVLTRTGNLLGWDYRSDHCMSRLKLPTLALPSGLVLSRDASTAAVGYASGKLTTVDLRKNIVAKTFRAGMGIQSVAASAQPGHVWLSTTSGDVCEFSTETGGAPKTHFLISDTAEAHAPIKIPHLVFADETFLSAHAEFEDSVAPETPFGCRAMRATSSGLFTAHNDAIVRLWNTETPGSVLSVPRLQTEPPAFVNQVGNVKIVAQQPPREPLNAREAHRDAILDFCIASLQADMLVTAGRDGLVKIWK